MASPIASSEGPKRSESEVEELLISEGPKRSEDGAKKQKRKIVPIKKPHQFFPNGPKVMLPKPKFPTGGSKPSKELHFGYNLLSSKEDMLILAEIALPSFNEGSEYELVDVLDCLPLPRIQYYHCNFIARLKNNTEAQDMLFFAEVKFNEDYIDDGDDFDFGSQFCCDFCCILGPVGSETGRFTGKSCCIGGHGFIPRSEGGSGLIHHPEDGYTSVRFECGIPKLTVV